MNGRNGGDGGNGAFSVRRVFQVELAGRRNMGLSDGDHKVFASEGLVIMRLREAMERESA